MGYNEMDKPPKKEKPMPTPQPKLEDFGNGIFIVWHI